MARSLNFTQIIVFIILNIVSAVSMEDDRNFDIDSPPLVLTSESSSYTSNDDQKLAHATLMFLSISKPLVGVEGLLFCRPDDARFYEGKFSESLLRLGSKRKAQNLPEDRMNICLGLKTIVMDLWWTSKMADLMRVTVDAKPNQYDPRNPARAFGMYQYARDYCCALKNICIILGDLSLISLEDIGLSEPSEKLRPIQQGLDEIAIWSLSKCPIIAYPELSLSYALFPEFTYLQVGQAVIFRETEDNVLFKASFYPALVRMIRKEKCLLLPIEDEIKWLKMGFRIILRDMKDAVGKFNTPRKQVNIDTASLSITKRNFSYFQILRYTIQNLSSGHPFIAALFEEKKTDFDGIYKGFELNINSLQEAIRKAEEKERKLLEKEQAVKEKSKSKLGKDKKSASSLEIRLDKHSETKADGITLQSTPLTSPRSSVLTSFRKTPSSSTEGNASTLSNETEANLSSPRSPRKLTRKKSLKEIVFPSSSRLQKTNSAASLADESDAPKYPAISLSTKEGEHWTLQAPIREKISTPRASSATSPRSLKSSSPMRTHEINQNSLSERPQEPESKDHRVEEMVMLETSDGPSHKPQDKINPLSSAETVSGTKNPAIKVDNPSLY